jgi:shikimate kinase
MKNIVLIGMPGSGKTTVGKELAKHGYTFIDTDEEIERETGLTIAEIFKKYGEEHFRALEHRVIINFPCRLNRLSTTSIGGGAFEHEQNRKILLENSFVIYLKADAETIYGRIKNERHRPLLQMSAEQDNLRAVSDLLNKRQHNYEQAHCIIDTAGKTPYDIVGEILGVLND